MKCEKCEISVMERTLHRTEPKGQSDAGWMCMRCIESIEPELAANIKSDDNYEVITAIESAVKK